MTDHKLEIAEFIVRMFTGILFIFQGYDKLFRIKMPGVINAFSADAEKYKIPGPLVVGVAWYTSVVEFFGGVFLLAGFLITYTLYALGFDLLLVSMAFSFIDPLWNLKHVFPRLLLIIILLIFPNAYRSCCIDSLLNLKY